MKVDRPGTDRVVARGAIRGFVARLRPQWLSWAGDYDHLARWGEWADGDEAAS